MDELQINRHADRVSQFVQDPLDTMSQDTLITADTSSGWTRSPDHTPEHYDIEDENARVKRRKISVEPTISPCPPANEPSPHHSTWQDQLQAAARTCIDLKESRGKTEKDIAPSPQMDDEVQPRPSLRSTSPPQPSIVSASTLVEIDPPQAQLCQPLQTDGAMDDPPQKEEKTSSTPKKKMLRNAQGKLSFSPQNAPRRSPRGNKVDESTRSSGKKQKTNPSKKIEMKNGKLVSSLRVSLPYNSPESGARIDAILSGHDQNGSVEVPPARAAQPSNSHEQPKTTHPFFLGKARARTQVPQADLKSEAGSLARTSEDEVNSKSSPKAPKAWKDIVFGSKNSSKQIETALPPIWPPNSLQHIPPNHLQPPQFLPKPLNSKTSSKLKQHTLRVSNEEDFLASFSRNLSRGASPSKIHLPVRHVISGNALVNMTSSMLQKDGSQISDSNSIARLKSRIQMTPSSFDNGSAGGPQIWSHEYAPTSWQDVLGVQSQVLYNWLSDLQVHQVQNGNLQKTKPPTPKKKRRKRKSDEMDDFIADSGDDDQSTTSGKNAILLVGPPGSGKTASVFAVAQQLGFEVFEIHPGMRRSARDIQDKVGDMMQNHLVQQSSSLSRESSVSIHDRTPLTTEPLPAKQKTVMGFLHPGRQGKQQKMVEAKLGTDSKMKSQKQSLILLEEVDTVFEEDRGFWSHVQWLIRTSKRPVILTCNDTDSIPLEELNLFAILEYHRPDPEVAVQHLGYIAAAEGHFLSRESLRNLFLSKSQDLRAAITELNLWCQMTVGSQQGGLDWMLQYNDRQKANADGSVTRIVSQDTYISGLDLLPQQFDNTEDLIRFTQDSLGISPLDWVEEYIPPDYEHTTRAQALSDMLLLCEARSAMDLFDGTTAPILASTIQESIHLALPDPLASRDKVLRLYLNGLCSSQRSRASISSTFDSLLDEPRIGLPTAPGRKAPSLDNPSAISIVTEVAPYVRSIVAHDVRLEQLRNELHGGGSGPSSQAGPNKRQRRTRAARAALEGGSKVTTRRDKWFPEELDWNAVMETGGGWPIVNDEFSASPLGSASASASVVQTPTPSPSAMVDEDELGV